MIHDNAIVYGSDGWAVCDEVVTTKRRLIEYQVRQQHKLVLLLQSGSLDMEAYGKKMKLLDAIESFIDKEFDKLGIA